MNQQCCEHFVCFKCVTVIGASFKHLTGTTIVVLENNLNDNLLAFRSLQLDVEYMLL
eukprot:m.123496 g.123496  ORF g.123496 m.123496 type:complete len:57 (-) comp9411_c1_seq1:1811-1981(-)